MITLGSLFDGSGGFPLAGALCGAVPLWASEIEPYPIAVTRSRFPEMKHLGNVTEICGDQIPPADIITFGSPCQDMSVAGKRAGLKHAEHGAAETTRSGLFYEAIRIIREMREDTNGRYPTFTVWENVPGAFTSNKGEDFRCVLEGLAKVCGERAIPRPAGGKWADAGEIMGDGFSVAWRVLDAQFWGVPQRRRRIYLVADFRGGRAGEILFERESVPGNPAQSGETRAGIAEDAAGSTGGSDRVGCLTPWDCQSKRVYQADGIFPTLPAQERGGQNGQSVVYCLQGNGIDRALTAGRNGCGWRMNEMYTLNTVDRPAVVYPEIARVLTARADSSPCVDRGMNVVALDCRNLKADSVSGTLQAKDNGGYSLNYQNPVIYDARGNGNGDMAPTLTGDHNNRITDYTSVVCMATAQAKAEIIEDGAPTIMASHERPITAYESQKPPRRYIVRRLTPTECARLQGFPDRWGVPDFKANMTDEEAAFWERVRKTHAEANGKAYKPCKTRAALIKWYNGLHSDASEYKMWGNGIALPCALDVVSGCVGKLREEAKEDD